MSDKITYLLGAGASANCLPVIDELPSRLDVLITQLNRIKITKDGEYTFPKTFLRVNIETLMTDLHWLKEEMKAHKTVDTLAKKYYLVKKRDNDLIKLKKLLIVYFMFEQCFDTPRIRKQQPKEMPDKRYDSFIATIIDKKRDSLLLAKDFKVITWNYDMQFEIAYQHYNAAMDIPSVQNLLQVIPTADYIKGNSCIDLSRFSIVRLNGVAGLSSFNHFLTNELSPSNLDENLPDGLKENAQQALILCALANMYISMPPEELSVFNYAWEDNNDYENLHPRKNSVIDDAVTIMKDTNILVVIGYSFPLFNRGVDKLLFNSASSLKKVYIQDINADKIKETIVSSFSILSERNSIWENLPGTNVADFKSFKYTDLVITTEAISDVNQFFIPPEADI